MDKCREEFEEKFGVIGTRMPNGNYSSWLHQAKWEVFQTAWKHQQAKVEELQKRLDGALKETQYALQYVEEDMRGNHEFLQMAMIRTLKAIEQVLKGGA